MKQLDLFEWASTRRTAQVINWIPHLAKRMWEERNIPIQPQQATIMDFRTTIYQTGERKRA
ncbi:hypothetical protein [Brucella lupini]|uniref:Uncharacterized protein n=1 Tax=Brucella lupini TaxID=255457 RepID=A0A256GC32_9HYPH|nr:hypothetical protein [Brucella lupini]KAB2706489.1 hypothetical protein F9L03_02125 [Brucella lupini]OYR24692.1 hypothetical protein CES86_4981 [Brucella lupini]